MQKPPPPRKAATERRLYPAKIEASSTRGADSAALRYDPGFAADGDPKTAWNEGAPGDGAGEWLRFAITKQEGVRRVRLKIFNGFQYNDAIYKANARAKVIEVRFSPDPKPRRATLEDKQGAQELVFETEAPVVDGIELRVAEVFPGAQYKDLAISDVELYVTSESPEQPDVEKKNLDELRASLKGPLPLADTLAMTRFEYGGDTSMPAAAAPYARRAYELAARELTLPAVKVTIGDKDIDAGEIALCIGTDFRTGSDVITHCLAPLFSVAGGRVAPAPKPAPLPEEKYRYHGPNEDDAPCISAIRADTSPDGKIHELVYAGCRFEMMRSQATAGWRYIALVYNDDGQLRFTAESAGDTWLDWVERDGAWTISGGVTTEPPEAKVSKKLVVK